MEQFGDFVFGLFAGEVSGDGGGGAEDAVGGVVGVGFGVFGGCGFDGVELADFEVEDGGVSLKGAGLEAEWAGRGGGGGESRGGGGGSGGLEEDVGVVFGEAAGGRDLVVCSNQFQGGVGEAGGELLVSGCI